VQLSVLRSALQNEKYKNNASNTVFFDR
jgi:hypothetical protein